MIAISPEYNPIMLIFCSGNHERDWPGTGSFYANMDSGGECGVLAETMFYVPAENRQKFWYMTSDKLISLISTCVREAAHQYTGPFEATTHVVVGGGGSALAKFTPLRTRWSYYQDYDFGFVKLTAFNQSTLLLEYKKSRDGVVYDYFTITRDYRDILDCAVDSCSKTSMSS
ncbi:hypothetical protein BHM03_00045196 [Ensete ventricosum]|uniref:Purple acid phosphatase C-terminal domain-containing protein n=1 Tax=Ensete ventricosum TaxID=4639 RepID=A0A445MKR9_ENSVE|nr:hypothetical protein BHM03_00045196 [Ensete ventricosum]